MPGLSARQAAMAADVVAATFAVSGENRAAARIALMTADTESSLEDLGPRAGNDGSLGLFQQRAAAGWGTPAEELNPAEATGMFVSRLLRVPGWAALRPWVAAQLVQRSAFTGIPSAANDGSRFALDQLGKPYVWAAAGPAAYDCSGLTMAAWATARITLAHYTVDQQHEGAPVSASGLQAGDLVLTPGSDSPGAGLAGHVGIYLGYGLVESAVDPQLGVVVQAWSLFVSGGIDALIDPDPADG